MSTRSVLAMAAAGKIQRKPERDAATNQRVILLHAGDVERIAYEREHPEATQALQTVPPQTVQAPHTPFDHFDATRQHKPATHADLIDLAQLLHNRIGAPGAVPKLWLTLDEAAEYSGIPADVLHELIRAGELAALDTHRRGNKYLVRRKTLDDFAGVATSNEKRRP